MDPGENFESFRRMITRPDSRRANSNNNISNSNGDNTNHQSVQGIEDALSSLSLSDNRQYLNSGGAFIAGGENGSLNLYNGENLYLPNGAQDYYMPDGAQDYYNTDVPVQDFIGLSNYIHVPSDINGNIFSSSSSNLWYNDPSLQGLGNSQYFNQNGFYQDYNRNLFAPSRGYSPRNIVEPLPSFNGNRHRRNGNGVGLGVDPRLVNAYMNMNGGVSARNRAVQQGFERISLSDLRGKIVALAMHQAGYRVLQSVMENTDEGGVAMIFAEVVDRIGVLMMDEFGNYIVQKLLEICSDEQKKQILRSVASIPRQLVRICVNIHGTRVMQKLLKHLTTREQISLIISALKCNVVELMKDINGCHVIDICLKHFAAEDIQPLVNEVVVRSYEVATDKSGCCIIQTFMTTLRGEARERLLTEIIQSSRLLAVDSYGNYVVQRAIELKDPAITARLLREFQGHFVSLSRNKYGSNVVEKFLIETGEVHAAEIITELLRSPNASILLTDPYGNFVIQKALLVTQVGPVYKALVNLIEMNAPAMQSNLFGKKILSRFQRRQPHNMHPHRNGAH